MASTSAYWSCGKAVSLLAPRYDSHPEGYRAPEVCVPGATKAGKYGKVQKAEQTLKVLKLTLELGELAAGKGNLCAGVKCWSELVSAQRAGLKIHISSVTGQQKSSAPALWSRILINQLLGEGRISVPLPAPSPFYINGSSVSALLFDVVLASLMARLDQKFAIFSVVAVISFPCSFC